ncbi:hypothetical protein SanJ4206_0896 [Streptococcus anginosus]|uniref:Uncharacterized protein n=1 Tax=Streptococcus anginosus SK1138 TaxID=1161422 RepID=A0AAD2Y9P5_STRAP|nr:hypothetical protein SanJ4206_0896 [Streptococcus anginosus]EJP25058.1 hypothetical protein HMPREF1126_1861 [Streptococcus anginosus SK1138]ETS94470.1 hypothetical protein HMPREF1512_1913 [Streptococcus sp. OBRC6]EUB14227.1 hypothetical protein HMPREF1510_0254 [Streptococcus sp. ACC21]EUC76376.1 hypothetical protein HMPREF1511_1928 [Streptococcus sp. CM7]EWC96910.1 hypothetical protein HMPREF1509_1908 [Streptococcus sp. AC15]
MYKTFSNIFPKNYNFLEKNTGVCYTSIIENDGEYLNET